MIMLVKVEARKNTLEENMKQLLHRPRGGCTRASAGEKHGSWGRAIVATLTRLLMPKVLHICFAPMGL
jgi:hypothetical protein